MRDSLEPLGQHHDRGFILPFAVAPVAGNGELRDLNVGGNSGCASLLTPDRKRHHGGNSFGIWCDESGQSDKSLSDSRSGSRSVWTVSLRQILEWIDRPVEFSKIDAQGMDLEIVTSGGSMLHLLERVLLEVVSDDCKPVYVKQPRCSEVVERMGKLGFKPLTPIPCTPQMPRLRANHYCELDYVFINAAAGITAQSTRDEIFEYQSGNINSCTAQYDILKLGHPHWAARNGKLRELAGDGQLVALHWHPQAYQRRALVLSRPARNVGCQHARLELFDGPRLSVPQYVLRFAGPPQQPHAHPGCRVERRAAEAPAVPIVALGFRLGTWSVTRPRWAEVGSHPLKGLPSRQPSTSSPILGLGGEGRPRQGGENGGGRVCVPVFLLKQFFPRTTTSSPFKF